MIWDFMDHVYRASEYECPSCGNRLVQVGTTTYHSCRRCLTGWWVL